jgi:hypothetical protein
MRDLLDLPHHPAQPAIAADDRVAEVARLERRERGVLYLCSLSVISRNEVGPTIHHGLLRYLVLIHGSSWYPF